MDHNRRHSHPYQRAEIHNETQYNADGDKRYKDNCQYSTSCSIKQVTDTNLVNSSSRRFTNDEYSKSMPHNYSYMLSRSSSISSISNKRVTSSTMYSDTPNELDYSDHPIKKIHKNQSMEQISRYSERICVSQKQKSSNNSTVFDQRCSIKSNSPNTNNRNYHNTSRNTNAFSSTHDNHNINRIEQTLSKRRPELMCDKSSNKIHQQQSTLSSSTIESSSYSGFLIGNCDDEEILVCSPPTDRSIRSSQTVLSTIDELNSNQKEQCLINSEPDVNSAVQTKNLKCQIELQRNLNSKFNETNMNIDKQNISKDKISVIERKSDHQQSASDWIIEHDAETHDCIPKITTLMNDDNDKIAKINLIVEKIKMHQTELRELRQDIISIFNVGQSHHLRKQLHGNDRTNEDLLVQFLNEPIMSGCWLCSGKTYREIAIQCNKID